MKALFYILRKTFKNYLLELKKKPLTAFLYLIVAASFVGMILISFLVPGERNPRGSAELFGAIMTAGLAVFLYFSISQGIERGSSFFRMSDVNFAFTAPISPKKVLIYGFVKQVYTILFTAFALVFQVPNIKFNFPINNEGVTIIYICIFLLFACMPLLGMLIYSFISKSKKAKSVFQKSLRILAGAFCLGFFIVIIQKKDIALAFTAYLNSNFFEYIPFLGWFKILLMGAVNGIDSRFYFNSFLIVASITTMVIAIYKSSTDYYEDVLASTEYNEELIKAKRSGKANHALSKGRLRKVKQAYKGYGASAVFYRQIMEYKKTGIFFLNGSTLFMAIIGIASVYIFNKLALMGTLYSSIYILFFMGFQGKWIIELNKPYIYLIPDSSIKKVIYATMPENIKNLVDGLVLFGAAGIVSKSDPASVVFAALAYTSFGALYLYGDVLSRRLLGAVHSANLSIFLKMLLIAFLIIPGIITTSILSSVLSFLPFSKYLPFISLIIYNLIISSIIILFCKGIFERLEAN